MPSRAAGNTYLPFKDLMKLETINEDTFRSIAQPFCPGGDHPRALGRAYGGHVYAQAAWAAAQTVPRGFVLHNVTGWFILGGLIDVPFIYKVHNIRDGRSYSTRIVNVTQARGKGVCFTCTCSFKTDEASNLDVQKSTDLWEKYAPVLAGKKPDDFREAPGMDLPFYWQLLESGHPNDMFPGLTTKKADMKAYNQSRHPLDRRQLIFYKAIGDLSPDNDNDDGNPNLHMCAHLYASDRNSLFIAANHLGVGDAYTQMGSLAHTVIFHAQPADLRFGQGQQQEHTAAAAAGPAEGKSEEKATTSSNAQGSWFCKEDRTDRASAGRATFHSRVWSPRGVCVASIVQDGMIRVGARPGAAAARDGRSKM